MNKLGIILKEIQNLKKDELVSRVKTLGITAIDKVAVEDMKVDELRSILLEKQVASLVDSKVAEIQKDGSKMTQKEVDELQTRTKAILEKATAINNDLLSHKTEDERLAWLDALDEELGLKGELQHMFPNLLGIDKEGDARAIIPATDDLPKSKIITSLPIRVLEQLLLRTTVNYPLMNLVPIEQVKLGIKQVIYGDYRDGDTTSGYSDVTIGDYNQGLEPLGTETYTTDINFHKGYDILDSILNDVALTTGLFIAIVADYANNIGKPMAKRLYQEVVTQFDSDATGLYDEVISFPLVDGKINVIENAKLLDRKLTTLNTPSRSHLKHVPTGLTKALEFQTTANDLHLVMNKEYAANYKYDVVKGTFQLGAINLQFKSIKELDFEKLTEYSNVQAASQKLKGYDLFIMSEGKLNIITHFTGTKEVNTPKLKSVVNTYMKFDTWENKSKIAIAFKQTQPTP